MRDHVDHHFARVLHVFQSVLRRVALHFSIRGKNDNGGVAAERIEKTVRREVRHAVRADGAGEGDWARRDRSEHELVEVGCWDGAGYDF